MFPPQCDVSVVPAGWEVAESQRKVESTLALAERGYIILPWPLDIDYFTFCLHFWTEKTDIYQFERAQNGMKNWIYINESENLWTLLFNVIYYHEILLTFVKFHQIW